MLSGNEHCHDERLTADDADGKAGSLAVVRLIRIRRNQKIPMVDELSGNGAKLCIFFQDAVLQNVGREEGITDPVSFAGRGEILLRTASAQFARQYSSSGFSAKNSTALLMSPPEFCSRYRNTVSAAESLPCIKWLEIWTRWKYS